MAATAIADAVSVKQLPIPAVGDSWCSIATRGCPHGGRAGLWAGRTDTGIDIVNLMRRSSTHGPTAKYGNDQRMLGQMLWPLIRGRCLIHDKHYHLAGIHEIALIDPQGHFGTGHQNLPAVLQEAERLGIQECCDQPSRTPRWRDGERPKDGGRARAVTKLRNQRRGRRGTSSRAGAVPSPLSRGE